jgi:ABC-type transporter Mla MlaB component
MTAEERALVKDGDFDREAWVALWDRLPERVARKAAVTFVLQQLHAIETGGRFSIQWSYETAAKREESDGTVYDGDQPGDLITFKGTVQIGERPRG